MKVKVCGITQLEQLEALPALGADLAGLIFVKDSKRYAREKLDPFQQIVRETPVKKVGVFVNSSEEEILSAMDDFGLSMAQLHGDEPAELVHKINLQLPVIQVFRLPVETELAEQIKEYSDACTYLLFDTRGKAYGGTGQKFDWRLLEDLSIGRPFFLSGGISPIDVEAVKAFNNRQPLFGVDINSGFETAPGIKDLEKISSFIRQLKDQHR